MAVAHKYGCTVCPKLLHNLIIAYMYMYLCFKALSLLPDCNVSRLRGGHNSA